MITIAEAQRLIVESAQPLPPVHRPVRQALGLILAEPIISRINSPPHDKSLVDGYAVRTDDLQTQDVSLSLLEEVTAGMVPTEEVVSGTTTRIMTGAPIPKGADGVVMIEQATCNDDIVRISDVKLNPGQNIMAKATSIREGQTVLKPGHRIRSIETGLLSELGVAEVKVYPPPTVAVLATGNELVPVGEELGQGQIRNSNGPMLCAMIDELGATAIDLGIARDDRESLTSLIKSGLKHDVLLLSGGVSAGVLDLVPSTLEQLGVRERFHRVAIRPGKPIWFGLGSQSTGRPTLVFGLPGNPVSSLVCFQAFVRTAVAILVGETERSESVDRLPLSADHVFSGNRPTYYPARVVENLVTKSVEIEPLPWHGSADLATLSGANCFAFFDGTRQEYKRGELVDVHRLN